MLVLLLLRLLHLLPALGADVANVVYGVVPVLLTVSHDSGFQSKPQYMN